MNTMNMPGFTAEVSLNQTSGHYQAGRQVINSPTQMTSVIYSAEIIEVYGCSPGYIQLGEGEDMVCIDPSDTSGIFGRGEGGGPGGVGHGGGGGGGGGGGEGQKPPPSPPKGQDKKGQKCYVVEPDGGKTFGRCDKVCKDLEITRKDPETNRWVCKSPPPPPPGPYDPIAFEPESRHILTS